MTSGTWNVSLPSSLGSSGVELDLRFGGRHLPSFFLGAEFVCNKIQVGEIFPKIFAHITKVLGE